MDFLFGWKFTLNEECLLRVNIWDNFSIIFVNVRTRRQRWKRIDFLLENTDRDMKYDEYDSLISNKRLYNIKLTLKILIKLLNNELTKRYQTKYILIKFSCFRNKYDIFI